ncbi:hypothetical protein XENTR_v10020296 [Xenopus tropicalis]|nr:hypothetical protein XENTR_v10020218 [Xenopus tropicalis]KAE8582810.1 hypothetical protein XENTR_v10020296 [Xenopus tropicalis]
MRIPADVSKSGSLFSVPAIGVGSRAAIRGAQGVRPSRARAFLAVKGTRPRQSFRAPFHQARPGPNLQLRLPLRAAALCCILAFIRLRPCVLTSHAQSTTLEKHRSSWEPRHREEDIMGAGRCWEEIEGAWGPGGS